MVDIHNSDTALYGREAGGAIKARDEWWKSMGNNDAQQEQMSGGMGFANGQAQTDRPDQAVENLKLANNEASGAGGNQQAALGLAGTLARGQQPSQAAYQLQSGLNQATAQQTAIGRSARGSAAIATAGADAAANRANLQQNAYTQGGMLKSQDMAQGRGMLASQLGTVRDQDNQRIGQANTISQYNGQANDAYKLGMGNAAVGFGDVANQQGGQDQQLYHQGMQPVIAQDSANQQHQVNSADIRKQAVNANEEDN